MKRSFYFGMSAILLATASAVQAGAYTEIQNNAFDGVNDASYVGKQLWWCTDDFSGYNILTLIEDTGPLTGLTGNVALELYSNFQNYNSTLTTPPKAYFTGGLMNLTFDYSSDGGTTWTPYQLRGSISQGSVEITSTSSSLSTLTGIFQFDTNDPTGGVGVENLPGSNNWPAPGKSTAVALSFAIGYDLSPLLVNPELWNYDLPTNIPGVRYLDTHFSLYPDERPIPEPASMLLLAVGSILVLPRRRAA